MPDDGGILSSKKDSLDQIVVLIEFTDEESARSWVEYLEGEKALEDAEMSKVEISYLNLVERGQL